MTLSSTMAQVTHMSDRWNVSSRRNLWLGTMVSLVVVAMVSVAYKLVVREYSLSEVLPHHRYDVTVEMSFDGHDGASHVRTFVPQTDERQQITELGGSSSPSLVLEMDNEGLNRRASWNGVAVPDATTIRYGMSILSSRRTYAISDELQVMALAPSSVRPYLRAEDAIQVDHPEVAAAVTETGADAGSLLDRLTGIYDYTSGLESRPFKGKTDALTALRLQAASCNGKSRLFVAMARAVGIPARLVGGLVMRSGRKRISHQWVEAYVAGHWVPFDPTNGHFAEIPERYLVLYRGDEALFSHTREINFDYAFDISTTMVPSPTARNAFGSWNLWALFERLSLPFSLLRTLLMLPAGALIVVLFRNVIGMPTYGTFLPALIAASVGDAGLLWAILCLVAVLAAVSAVRLFMNRLELLHSPTLAIVLAAVAASMLFASLLAERTGQLEIARATFFPVAVMAVAAERFYLSMTERGMTNALTHLGGTLVVVVCCAIVMHSLALQILLSGFPEILLIVVAANVYLGRWVGVRLLEHVRFQTVLRGTGA